jgi:hypothetical protein
MWNATDPYTIIEGVIMITLCFVVTPPSPENDGCRKQAFNKHQDKWKTKDGCKVQSAPSNYD